MASLFLLVSISLAFLCNSQADLVGKICSQSTNPSLCNKSLRSDPRSKTTDLRVLAQVAVEKSEAAVQATKDVAKSFDKGKDKAKAEACTETCGDSIDELKECRELIKAHDIPSIITLQTKASTALTDVGTCDDEFEEGEPAALKQASRKA